MATILSPFPFNPRAGFTSFQNATPKPKLSFLQRLMERMRPGGQAPGGPRAPVVTQAPPPPPMRAAMSQDSLGTPPESADLATAKAAAMGAADAYRTGPNRPTIPGQGLTEAENERLLRKHGGGAGTAHHSRHAGTQLRRGRLLLFAVEDTFEGSASSMHPFSSQ